tara:strand:+ start:5272 stop:5637 length:366 start_codon:yes stop_codon:yes gene_type:complete
MGSAETLLTVNELEDSMWGKRILAAKARGGWNADDLSMSGNWATCACGQMDPWIEVDNTDTLTDKRPLDRTLFVLGCDFGNLEYTGDAVKFDRAARLLIAIHTRSMELYDEAVLNGKDWTK